MKKWIALLLTLNLAIWAYFNLAQFITKPNESASGSASASTNGIKILSPADIALLPAKPVELSPAITPSTPDAKQMQ
ncbi:hypothetical protein MCETRH20_00838 [Methylophilaceae bacterium]